MEVSILWVGDGAGLRWVIVIESRLPCKVLDEIGEAFHRNVVNEGRDLRDFMKQLRRRFGPCSIYSREEWLRRQVNSLDWPIVRVA